MSHDYQDDPHLLQAIGEVVVAASRLEYHVARLVWLVTGREVRKTLRPNGVRDALAALADSAHAEGLNDVMRELGPQTLWLLRQRHESFTQLCSGMSSTVSRPHLCSGTRRATRT